MIRNSQVPDKKPKEVRERNLTPTQKKALLDECLKNYKKS